MKPASRRVLLTGLGLAALLSGGPLGAEELRLSLDSCVRSAMETSPRLKAAAYDLAAARAAESGGKAALLPTLSLTGYYDYLANVLPPINLPPQMAASFGTSSLDFGFHNMWSLGVSANWDIFGMFRNWRQVQAEARARAAAREAYVDARQNLLLGVRLAYFRTQLAATQVRLYVQALKLAQSQLHDLDERLKAGTSSRIDWLTASNDELDQRAGLRMAQVTLAGALRDLFALTGQDEGADLSLPVDAQDAGDLPARVAAATVAVGLDATPDLLSELAPAARAPFRPQDLARLRALDEQVAEARAQVEVAFAGHMPTGTVGFLASEEYPEQPLPQQVFQQTTSFQGSLPLFAFGRVHDQVLQARAAADSRAQAAADALIQARTDWLESRDRLEGLSDQRALQDREAAQARALREAVYRSYKIGGSTFLQVQTTTLEELQAGLALAQTETNMLIELANLAALTANDR